MPLRLAEIIFGIRQFPVKNTRGRLTKLFLQTPPKVARAIKQSKPNKAKSTPLTTVFPSPARIGRMGKRKPPAKSAHSRGFSNRALQILGQAPAAFFSRETSFTLYCRVCQASYLQQFCDRFSTRCDEENSENEALRECANTLRERSTLINAGVKLCCESFQAAFSPSSLI